MPAVGYEVFGYFNRGVVEVEVEPTGLPADLLAAIEWAFHGFAPLPSAMATPSMLADAFGEVMFERPAGSGQWLGTKIRRSEAGSGDSIPYVVVDFDLISEVDYEFDGVATQERRLVADVYAFQDAEATRLAKRFRDYFGLHYGGAGEIEWEDGIVIRREMEGSEPEEIDPVRGPDGQMIRGRRVRVLFEVQFQGY